MSHFSPKLSHVWVSRVYFFSYPLAMDVPLFRRRLRPSFWAPKRERKGGRKVEKPRRQFPLETEKRKTELEVPQKFGLPFNAIWLETKCKISSAGDTIMCASNLCRYYSCCGSAGLSQKIICLCFQAAGSFELSLSFSEYFLAPLTSATTQILWAAGNNCTWLRIHSLEKALSSE